VQPEQLELSVKQVQPVQLVVKE
jgi:hypothetical protein